MSTPDKILALAFDQVSAQLDLSLVDNSEVRGQIEYVCRNIQNRAGVRVLLACLLAKIHQPEIDIRKPYTEIGDADSYSGRSYDETYVTGFIIQHDLPCNHTTAFLTPALRNRNIVLTPAVNLVGRPPKLYETVLQLLHVAHTGQVEPETMLTEIIRWLLIIRNERQQRMTTLLAALNASQADVPLSSESIVQVISQHLQQPKASRLPVLVVAAAYQAASAYLGEQIMPLESHTAADSQTQALGDIEITLLDDDKVVTSYEMKNRRVTQSDIDRALQKIGQGQRRVDNYIFITTETIDVDVQEYASSIYDQTNGIEVVILDGISFLRHFLHLFHRLRVQFLEAYQTLLLAEPDSAVSQPLKEVFLVLRQAAESGE